MFLLSGISLKTSELVRSFTFWRLHLFVQAFNLILIPPVVFGIVKVEMRFDLTVETADHADTVQQ